MVLETLYAEIALLTLALAVLVLGLAAPAAGKKAALYVTLLGIAAVIAMQAGNYFTSANLFGGIYRIDAYSGFFKLLILFALFIVVLSSADFVAHRIPRTTEFYSFLLFAALGMFVLVSSADFITLYIGLELMTISFYVLVSICYEDQRSSEAGIKYLILGAIGSATLLFGMSYIVALSGTTLISDMAANLTLQPALVVGVVMITAGFAFKVSLIPFHMWTPDVYQGAPTPVTMFLSVASKAAAFAAMIRVFALAFPDVTQWVNWPGLLSALAALTILAGNLLALPQTNTKRLLAYSSIAQAGYMIIGLLAINAYSLQGLLYYAMLYVFSNLGAFTVVSVVEAQSGSSDFSAIAGLGRRSPFLAATMTICLLSLAGIPPLAGFVGKLYLFVGAVEAGYLWLTFLGLIMSMVSAYYYLNLAKVMYAEQAVDEEKIKTPYSVVAGLSVCLIGTIFLGVYPGPLAELAAQAVRLLGSL
jgi:NADH-quinone oxidoreductase subunit N